MTSEAGKSEVVQSGQTQPDPAPSADRPARSAAAERALAEAAERRARAEKEAAGERNEMPTEFNGRDGPDPVRYGDWESRGIASDF